MPSRPRMRIRRLERETNIKFDFIRKGVDSRFGFIRNMAEDNRWSIEDMRKIVSDLEWENKKLRRELQEIMDLDLGWEVEKLWRELQLLKQEQQKEKERESISLFARLARWWHKNSPF